MPEIGSLRQVLDGETVADTAAASRDLVPVTETLREVPKRPLPRPDAGFVAQLIATAALAPQTSHLRRGTAADAQTAYGPGPKERRGVARRTRQII